MKKYEVCFFLSMPGGTTKQKIEGAYHDHELLDSLATLKLLNENESKIFDDFPLEKIQKLAEKQNEPGL